MINFAKIKPKHPSDIIDRGFKLKRLGSGAFREVFEIVGQNVVIKFPINGESNIHHAQEEIRVLKMIHSKPKYKGLRGLVPEVLYSDLKNGVIVMKRYHKMPEAVARGAAKAIHQAFKELLPQDECADNIEYTSSDIESYNVMGEYVKIECWDGKKRRFLNKVVLIDLGLV